MYKWLERKATRLLTLLLLKRFPFRTLRHMNDIAPVSPTCSTIVRGSLSRNTTFQSIRNLRSNTLLYNLVLDSNYNRSMQARNVKRRIKEKTHTKYRYRNRSSIPARPLRTVLTEWIVFEWQTLTITLLGLKTRAAEKTEGARPHPSEESVNPTKQPFGHIGVSYARNFLPMYLGKALNQ